MSHASRYRTAPRPRGAKIALFAMVVAVAAANHLAVKPMGPWLTWGTPVIAATFFINELTHQRYGPKMARWVVTRGFWAALSLSLVLSPVRIALASASAYLSAQLFDIAIFARLRTVRGRLWWLAPATASIAASVLDTAIFFVIAFVGTGIAWWQLACGDFLCKLLVDVLMLLPFRLALRSAAAQRPHAWAGAQAHAGLGAR